MVRLILHERRIDPRHIITTLGIALGPLERRKRDEDHKKNKACDRENEDDLDDRKALMPLLAILILI